MILELFNLILKLKTANNNSYLDQAMSKMVLA